MQNGLDHVRAFARGSVGPMLKSNGNERNILPGAKNREDEQRRDVDHRYRSQAQMRWRVVEAVVYLPREISLQHSTVTLSYSSVQ